MKKRFESNGDTIRNMSNEELSEMLATMDMSPDSSNRIADQKEWLDWLYSDSELKWQGKTTVHMERWCYTTMLVCLVVSIIGSTISIIISLLK